MTISLFSRKTRCVFRAVLLVSSLAGVVNAQDNVGDESTVIYRADYFAEFNPITAQDMVDRIPGVGGATGSGGGFGFEDEEALTRQLERWLQSAR